MTCIRNYVHATLIHKKHTIIIHVIFVLYNVNIIYLLGRVSMPRFERGEILISLLSKYATVKLCKFTETLRKFCVVPTQRRTALLTDSLITVLTQLDRQSFFFLLSTQRTSHSNSLDKLFKPSLLETGLLPSTMFNMHVRICAY